MFRCNNDSAVLEKTIVDRFHLDLTDESQMLATLHDDIDQFLSHVLSWASSHDSVAISIGSIAKIALRWAEPAEKSGSEQLNELSDVFIDGETGGIVEQMRSRILDEGHGIMEMLNTLQADVDCQARIARDIVERCLFKLKKCFNNDEVSISASRESVLSKLNSKDAGLGWAIEELEGVTQKIRDGVFSVHEQRRDFLRNASIEITKFGLHASSLWEKATKPLECAIESWNKLPNAIPERNNPDLLNKDSLNVRMLLHNSTAYQYYRQFLSSELASENGDFIQAIISYENAYESMTNQERTISVNAIVDEFVRDNSPKQVNIDSQTRIKVTSVVDALLSQTQSQAQNQNVTIDLFDGAKHAILELLRWDSVPKFKESPYYQALKWRINGNVNAQSTATDNVNGTTNTNGMSPTPIASPIPSAIQEKLVQIAFKAGGHRLLRVGSGLGRKKNVLPENVVTVRPSAMYGNSTSTNTTFFSRNGHHRSQSR